MRLRRVEPHLRRALAGPCRLPRGATLLVAVSGGADSTALLAGLARVTPEFGLTLHAAHLHHGLRGSAADADLRLVRRLCASLGVPLLAARCDAAALMRRHGLAGENGLRVLRRRFLHAARRRSGAAAIATAHTADDQLETVLMRLLRGSGLTGLGGMRERHGAWLKPLLDATRLEIASDLRRARIAWREDASNLDPAWTRNRVRHRAIPALLAALDPGLAGAGARGPVSGRTPEQARAAFARRVALAAREARDARRAIGVWLGRSLPSLAGRSTGPSALPAEALASLPIAARRMALRRAFGLTAPPGTGLTRRHLAALCNLVGASCSRGRVDLPEGVRAERAGGTVRFIAGSAETPARKPITSHRPSAAVGRRPESPPSPWGEP